MAGEKNDFELHEFEGEGKKYYEVSFYFNAQVPYENEGWSNGQDLAKLDQKLLLEKVLEFYDYYKDIYTDDKRDELAKNLYSYIKREAISQYYPEKNIKEIWDECERDLKVKKEWLPLNYSIKYYGDGKIISLLQSSKSDPRFRGESALGYKYKEDGYNYARFIGVYLYLPKGKKLEDGLEVL